MRAYAVNTVPEHTFALILALRRGIVGYRQDVIDGQWLKAGQFCFFTHPIRDLAGSTLGIIGEGAIGQSVARLGQAFGMRTLFAAHKGVSGLGPLYTPFDEVLETSDVITLHSPLLPGTRNMIGMPEFRKMKKRPLLINTARGGLVVEEDLVQAVKEGLIAGAGFDCITKEPLPRRPLFPRDHGPTQRDHHAARRLGQPGGHADPVAPGDRHDGGFPGRAPLQCGDVTNRRGLGLLGNNGL